MIYNIQKHHAQLKHNRDFRSFNDINYDTTGVIGRLKWHVLEIQIKRHSCSLEM